MLLDGFNTPNTSVLPLLDASTAFLLPPRFDMRDTADDITRTRSHFTSLEWMISGLYSKCLLQDEILSLPSASAGRSALGEMILPTLSWPLHFGYQADLFPLTADFHYMSTQ